MRMSRWLSVALIGVLAAPTALAAQRADLPSHSLVVSGYGTAGWLRGDGLSNGFFTSLAPIFLFSMSDRVFAEAELEFELEDGVTRTGLEYATVHYLASDRVTASAGKFLVPFGVFSQRTHPTWINRFPSAPPIYGGHGGVPGNTPLLPILMDIGAMASVVMPLNGIGRSIALVGYLTNGPRVEAAGDHEEAEEEEDGHGALPDLAYGASSGDNNADKMVGGRASLVLAPGFELNLSALTARWGTGEVGVNQGKPLRVAGYNLAAEYRPRGGLEFRTEWVWTRTDLEEVEDAASMIETRAQFGGYTQATWRRGPWEPVARFTLVDHNQGGDAETTWLRQYGVGLNYWFGPSVALMAGYEFNRDNFDQGMDLANDRFLIHWAFGF